jgi:maltose alpha-D-glucosyltransferase/alpha-amylase
LTHADREYLLLQSELTLANSGKTHRYFVPLDKSWEDAAGTTGWPLTPFMLAKARRHAKVGAIYDALAADHFTLAVIDAMRNNLELRGENGTTLFKSTPVLQETAFDDAQVSRMGVEQSNSSVMIGDKAVLKIYRRLTPGEHPEIEIARFLTQKAGYANIPPLLGTAEQQDADGTLYALAVLTGFVRNQGDGWTYTMGYLDRFFDEARLGEGTEMAQPCDQHATYLEKAKTLGRRTAELHLALASDASLPAFAPEPIGPEDFQEWRRSIGKQASQAFAALKRRRNDPDQIIRGVVEKVLARREECMAAIQRLTSTKTAAAKIRIHGDYHLGQVLIAQNDFYLIDFEGEPARSLEERRAKNAAFKDVAGMLRSFEYAGWAALFARDSHEPDAFAKLEPAAEAWRKCTQQAFLDSYFDAIGDSPSCPPEREDAMALLNLFLLEKALYEINYEAANRPTWLRIPIAGLNRLLDALAGMKG